MKTETMRLPTTTMTNSEPERQTNTCIYRVESQDNVHDTAIHWCSVLSCSYMLVVILLFVSRLSVQLNGIFVLLFRRISDICTEINRQFVSLLRLMLLNN